jgi:hypothetical protein
LKEATAAPVSSPERFSVEQYLEPARGSLAADMFAAAKAEGAGTGLDVSIAYALGEIGDAGPFGAAERQPPQR